MLLRAQRVWGAGWRTGTRDRRESSATHLAPRDIFLWGEYELSSQLLGLKREVFSIEDGACDWHASEASSRRVCRGRVLPERADDCWIRTAHHRSIKLFSWAWQVGENSFRGFLEPTERRTGQLATQREGRRITRSRAACVQAHKPWLIFAY